MPAQLIWYWFCLSWFAVATVAVVTWMKLLLPFVLVLWLYFVFFCEGHSFRRLIASYCEAVRPIVVPWGVYYFNFFFVFMILINLHSFTDNLYYHLQVLARSASEFGVATGINQRAFPLFSVFITVSLIQGGCYFRRFASSSCDFCTGLALDQLELTAILRALERHLFRESSFL